LCRLWFLLVNQRVVFKHRTCFRFRCSSSETDELLVNYLYTARNSGSGIGQEMYQTINNLNDNVMNPLGEGVFVKHECFRSGHFAPQMEVYVFI